MRKKSAPYMGADFLCAIIGLLKRRFRAEFDLRKSGSAFFCVFGSKKFLKLFFENNAYFSRFLTLGEESNFREP